MLVYSYDGTFDGLLTVISLCLDNNEDPEDIILFEEQNLDLFSEKIYIKTDINISTIFIQKLINKFSRNYLKNIFYAFLSNSKSSEIDIFNFIKYSFQINKDPFLNYSHKFVQPLQNAIKRLKIEVQRYKGILRFQELKNNLFYASIEPDNNIVVLLINHFKNRFGKQKWLIHDIKRGFGVYFNGIRSEIIEIHSINNNEKNYIDYELDYQNLWKTYFKSITIEERKNLKLQRQYIPVRYWNYLIEKN